MMKQTPSGGMATARLLTSCLLLLVIVGFMAVGAQAQVLYGGLTGNVTDPSGAAVAGAKVEALNVATGVSRETTTDEAGIYRFAAIQPGTYKVTITAPKFASFVTENVAVVVNNIRRVDADLKVASGKEDVTVTGEAPLLQTDKADVHTDITSNTLTNLPLTSSVAGRNFQSILRIVPGFGNLTEQNSAGGNPQRAMSTNVNGQDLQTINTRIDGAQDAYPWLPGNVAYVPPADAIETVNVVTNSFDPEQGMAGGAAVNVQIKSGTNSLHGSAHEFHNDQSLRTRNYFKTDPVRFPTKSRENKNQFGGTIGGPIVKDKLFFFGDYERTTQRQLAQGTTTLPTAAMRTGDFSAFLPAFGAGEDCNTGKANPTDPTKPIRAGCIFDPTTGQPFAGNIIPTNRIDPAAAKLVAQMPGLTSPSATTNNYVTRGTGEFNRDNIDGKVNWQMSQKATMFGRYSFSKSHIFDPPSLGIIGGDATAGGQLGNSDSRIQSVGLGGTYTFTPTVLADWNLGFTRQRLGASNVDIDQAYGLTTLGISGTNNAGTTGDPSQYYGYPAFQISGVSNVGNVNTGNPFLFRDNQYVWGANLSWNHGKHAFRFGAEYNHTQMNHFQPQGSDGNFTTARGSFNFNGNVTTFGSNQTGTNPANSFAQFLLGLPNRAGKATLLNNPVALRWSQWAWYVRDQWQVMPQLTLTLGVRWEYYPFGYSDHDRGLALFNPTDGNVYIGGVANVPKNDFMDVGSGQFLPRIGLAYRVTDKTVIRAGYGMSADPSNYHFLRNAYPSTITTDPVGGSSTNPAYLSLTGTNAVGLLSALPVGLASSLVANPNISTGVVPLPNGAGTRTFTNPFRRGYINSFNFIVQQEYKGVVVEAGYVGARAIRPLTNVNLNSAQICPFSGNFDTATPPNPLMPNGAIRNSANCLAQGYGRLLNVNGHNWGGIGAMMPFKNNYYDSLQTKVTRRFAGSSQVGLVYTYSKAINYAENSDLSGLFEHDPKLWELNRALAGFDRTHNLQMYAVYELPFGKGKRWATEGVANAIAGGWQLNAVVSRLSGTPFSITGNNTFLNPAVQDGLNNPVNQVGQYAVLDGKPWSGAGTCPLSQLSCHYFDPAVFAQPGLGVLGNTRRNNFRGPGIFNADLSVFRNFKITERFTFQFRAEMFGLTNTPRFNNPNSGCGSTTAGSLCSTATSTNNFGAVTATNGTSGSNASTDGTRTIWFAGKLTF